MILYQEYPPHPALISYVECLWTCSVGLEVKTCSYRVLPDNGIDILWQDQDARGFAVGMMTTANTVVIESQVRTVAVRFKPGRAAHFFRIPLDELTDSHADMRDLWGRGAADRMTDALWTRPLTDRERLNVLEQHLLDYLTAREKICRPGMNQSDLVDHAVTALESSHGLLKIGTLANAVGVSRQHLALQFRAHVGITTKTFARICRFRRAVADIRNARAPAARIDWATLALDCGYFDQSHLIHEFHEFSGGSPDSFA
jgi:AraC-like DNA-binding protein